MYLMLTKVKTKMLIPGWLPHIFGYKTGVFPFKNDKKHVDQSKHNSAVRRVFTSQNNTKNLDPSYKTDLDLRDYFGGENPFLVAI